MKYLVNENARVINYQLHYTKQIVRVQYNAPPRDHKSLKET